MFREQGARRRPSLEGVSFTRSTSVSVKNLDCTMSMHSSSAKASSLIDENCHLKRGSRVG